MIPRSREEKIQWVRRHLLPLLESELTTISDENVDESKVNRSKDILAEEYLEEGGSIFKNILKVALPLLVIDSLTYMPPEVYGLVFSITGTWIMLVEADVLGSESIAVRAMDSLGGPVVGTTFLDEGHARRLAYNTVMVNIGIVWLSLGFIMQIVAIWAIPSQTMIQPLL